MHVMTRLSRVLSLWALTFVERWQGGARSLVALAWPTGGLWGRWGMVSGIGCSAEGFPWPPSQQTGKDPPRKSDWMGTIYQAGYPRMHQIGKRTGCARTLLEPLRAGFVGDDESSQGV